ncbi:alpha/beta hydrolase [Pseudomonas prosekii]|uniref:Alpha/beta hydrolase n=1 Tax=Pseudomonas prosekii TaxID=1148509 RepID=A0A3L8CTJ5_9PSED|nr:alpha/beta hydrolase [Pseudomonas prosekii]RLU08109.1 alpha/beta hydrolase [Pseudomonas prosekii]RLU11577.1 alpha/beta hydrolase [Pseudomonas prosekii]
MKPLNKLCLIAASLLMLGTGAAMAAEVAPVIGPVKANNVVLVHGSWADGSSWSEVITRLQAAGLHVTAVQNPLTSVADDVAATQRVLNQQDGPTVLVGHSYAGTVVSEAGVDPKVSSLVYVAARAPDAGEDFVALSAKYPTMPVRAGTEEHDGYVTLKQDAFLKYFAGDVPRDKAMALFAVQQPIAKTLFGERTTAAAWRSKPSWYAVSSLDQTINPDLERFFAKRMGATTIELPSSHLSLVSHSKEIADLILEASGRQP